MKKIFIILFVMFLLTGCHGTATFDIGKNSVTEDIRVSADSKSEYIKISNWNGFPLTKYYDQELKNPFSSNRKEENGVSYYNVIKDETNNAISSSNSFGLSEHKRSSLVRGCFKLYNVINEGNVVIFSTSKGLICNFYNFDIVVKSDYLILNSNASSIDKENNVYTWHASKANRSDLGIYFEVDFSKKFSSLGTSGSDLKDKEDKENDKSISAVVIIFIVLCLIVVGIYVIKFLKKKKDNLSEI